MDGRPVKQIRKRKQELTQFSPWYNCLPPFTQGAQAITNYISRRRYTIDIIEAPRVKTPMQQHLHEQCQPTTATAHMTHGQKLTHIESQIAQLRQSIDQAHIMSITPPRNGTSG